MTAHAMPVSAAPADLRPVTRVLAAVILPIGPAAVAVLRYVMPYHTTDDETAIVREVAVHQSTQSAVVWLGLIGALFLVPAVILVGGLTRRAAPRLTLAALLLLVPAYTALPLLAASDAAVLFAVRHHLDTATAAQAYSSLHPVFALAGVVFVIGHVFGTIMLGLAMWRTSVVPHWAAAATVVAQPLHFVAAIIVSSHTLDLVGWGLNVVGFAAVSWAILRMSDEAWEPAPRST